MDLRVDRGLGCNAQDLVSRAAALSHPKPGWAVLMFPDGSDKRWGSFLTQALQGELERGIPVEGMTHFLN